ncbi:unnamed protein product [Allacma fusca]|uniref:Uncharacterized protein n=1 Tax=Allacma fusca TaxID=39272 RepID=A0A8J2JJ32_9HEXA|nr:unnamed protein product [Allacma fusca]
MSSLESLEDSPVSQEGKKLLEIATKDRRDMRAIFRDNFGELTERTQCVDKLVNTLYGFKVLDITDKRKIRIPGQTDPDRMDILYHIVEKSDKNWEKLIRAWELTNNEHIITLMLEFIQKPYNQHNQCKEVVEESVSSSTFKAIKTERKISGGQTSNKDEQKCLINNKDVESPKVEEGPRNQTDSLKKGILILSAVLAPLILTVVVLEVVNHGIILNLLLSRNENHHITTVETKTQSTVVNSVTQEPVRHLVANSSKTELGKEILKNEEPPYHESFEGKRSKSEFIKFTPLEEMEKETVEEPLELSKLPETPNEILLAIIPTKVQNWDNVKISNSDNVRAIAFAGYLNPESVISVIKKLRLFLTHITFSFENRLCDEFYDYSALPSASKVELPFLQEIHFKGDVDCGNVFRFITNEVSLSNIRILKFSETNMIYNSVSFVRQIFQDSQSTLEYIYLNGVSFCSNCKLFGNLEFSRLKLAEFSFNSGVSAPENADAINRFNSNIPENCRSTYPNVKKVRVEC